MLTRTFALVALLSILTCSYAPRCLAASATPEKQTAGRKVAHKVAPAYPELARRLNIQGTVRLQLIVEANGKIKSAKAIGGHPTLVQAAMDVIDKWRYVPAPQQTTETVEMKFEPQQ